MIRITDEEFKLWNEFIYELTGIVLTHQKKYLIENRLAGLVGDVSCRNYKDLLFKCRYTNDTRLIDEVINRISTQETSFFRDPPVFETLGELIRREIVPAKQKAAALTGLPRLKVWSAACSGGQEPYTIAMVLAENIHDLSRWQVEILATDIADNAFAKASLGRYSELEISRGLTDRQLERYFDQQDENTWQVKASLKKLVRFRKLNLVTESFQNLGSFDLIFCRNVAIYFDHNTKVRLFHKLERVLAPDGRLFVGATESLSQIVPIFTPINRYKALFYEKNRSENPQAAGSPERSGLAGATPLSSRRDQTRS